MREIVLNVKGMECVGCSNRIQNTLSSIEGIKSIVANHENDTVIIKMQDEVEENMIIEEIQNIGFKVIGKV